MRFLCPECGGSSLEVEAVVELPADAEWDERQAQILVCTACRLEARSAYLEVRRGADSRWRHGGVRLEAQAAAELRELFRQCTRPRDRGCTCEAHRTLAAQDWTAQAFEVRVAYRRSTGR